MNKDLNKYLELAIEALVFIFIITVSLIFDRRLGIVFSLTKTTAIRVLILLIMSLLSVRIFIGGKINFKKSLFDWHVLSYLLCVAAATITSINVYTSFAGSYGRYEGYSTIIIFGLMFFLSTNFLTDNAKRITMSVLILACASVMALYGIIQRMELDPYMWGGVVTNERVIATIGQPNFLAAYLIMAAMLGFALLARPNRTSQNIIIPNEKAKTKKQSDKKSTWPNDLYDQAAFVLLYIFMLAFFVFLIFSPSIDSARNPAAWYVAFSIFILSIYLFAKNFEKIKRYLQDILVIVSISLIYIGILFTQSRGGLIGFVGGLSLFFVLMRKDLFFENWKKFLFMAFVLAAISGLVFFLSDSSPIARFGEEIKVDQKVKSEEVKVTGAAGSRLETWKSAFGMISDRPVFGIGPEVMKSVFPRYETQMFRFYEAFHVKQDRCHNETLDVPVTKGIIALFVYSWLIISIFIYGIKKIKTSDPESSALIVGFLAACIGYLFQNQFSFGVVAITVPFWVLLGSVAGFSATVDDKKDISVKPQWFICSVAVLLLIFLSYLSVLQYNADICFKSGKMYFDGGNAERALSEYKKAADFTPLDGGIYTNAGIAALNLSLRSGVLDRWFSETVNIFSTGTVVDPYNADNYYLRAKIYLSFAGADKNFQDLAVSDSIQTLKIDPYYAEAYINLAIAYEVRGHAKEAAQMYEKAFIINPTMIAWLNEIERIYSKNNIPGIVSVFENILKKYPDRTEVLSGMGVLYLQKGMLERAKQIFEQILSVDNKNIAGINGLAGILLKQGNIEGAFLKYQEALVIDPRNVETHNGLGFVYYKNGKLKEAKEEFEIILIYDPANEHAKKMLNVL